MRRYAPGIPMRRLNDMLRQSAGVLVVIVGVVVVGGGAIAMGPVIARFGPVGWLVFAILMGGWLMFCVPFLMAGFELRNSGSERQRRARAVRIQEQREHFGLIARTRPSSTDDDHDGSGPA